MVHVATTLATSTIMDTSESSWVNDLSGDDDPALLQAAMAFIETCDFSDTSDGSSSVVHAPDLELTCHAAPVKRRRLKDEIGALRELVARLETIRTEKHRDRTETAGQREDSEWVVIARCQKELRTAAEGENAKLRAAVQQQLSIARRLVTTATRCASLKLPLASPSNGAG